MRFLLLLERKPHGEGREVTQSNLQRRRATTVSTSLVMSGRTKLCYVERLATAAAFELLSGVAGTGVVAPRLRAARLLVDTLRVQAPKLEAVFVVVDEGPRCATRPGSSRTFWVAMVPPLVSMVSTT